MAKPEPRMYDLGKSGTVVMHVSEELDRLLIEFNVDARGLTKTGVNSLIDALKETRKGMKR